MADSSSDSDPQLRPRRRGPLRATHDPVSHKIHQLASTLQDTSRSLKQVDEMLGEYRGHSADQSHAIASLKESLEQSIGQLRSRRLSRLSGGRSASLSSLCAADLDSAPGTRRVEPTSPLRDYPDAAAQRRRRSRSASVRFLDEAGDPDERHSLHQSLRDLSADQLRLHDDLNRELTRRNRSEAETRRALKELSARCSETQRQETASERVERRLQQLEEELRAERRQHPPGGQVSPQLQEALKKPEARPEVEASLRDTLGRVESERSQLKEELERYRRRLDQSEGTRDTLQCQVEDLRARLLKMEEDRARVQQQISLQSQQEEREEERRMREAVERSEQGKRDLERQITELRSHVDRSAVLAQITGLERSLEQSERERGQLAARLEGAAEDLERREEQQRKMLEQLREIQSRYESCERERRLLETHNAELLQQLEEVTQEAERCLGEAREADKKREETKRRAQETLRHWRLRCKRLEREGQKRAESESHAQERCAQAVKEAEETRCQLQVTAQRAESLRQELGEVLSKRAEQEEELRQRQERLAEAREQQAELERELRESQELAGRLQGELQRQVAVQLQVEQDRERLEAELASVGRAREQSREREAELQEAVRDLSAERARLAERLAQEERSGRELQRSLREARKEAELAREELGAAGRQLEMERDAHQREVTDLRQTGLTAKGQHQRATQDMLQRFRQERAQLEAYIHSLEAELSDSQSLVSAERLRLDKMKLECDKLSEQTLQERETSAMMRCKNQEAAQDAMEKDRRLDALAQTLRTLEETNQTLREKLNSAQMEQETILCAIDTAMTSACQLLPAAKSISTAANPKADPHYWLAETKARLAALCEEVREREERERRLRRHLQEEKGKRERQAEEAKRVSADLLERNRRRDDEMLLLQDRIMDLERSTRMALDHLESVPEKLNLLDDMKDLSDWQRQREVMEERYAQYREIVSALQQQLEDSKSRIQEYRDERVEVDVQSSRLVSLSSLHPPDTTLTCTLRSHHDSPVRRGLSSGDLKTSVRLREAAS